MAQEKKISWLEALRADPVCKDTDELNDEVLEWTVVDTVVKTGKEDDEFYVKKVQKVTGKHSRKAEINKFRNDVGCVNIIKKFARQGIDAGDGRFAAKGPAFTDATKLPKDLEETIELSKQIDPRVSAVWKSIPSDLKGNMDIKTFAEKFNADMFKGYVDKKFKKPVQPEIKKEEVKE